MPNVTVTVAGTEGPKPGKKRGRIKDEEGKLYQISPLLMEMVKKGSSYDIDYKDEEFNNGREVIKYRVVESLAPAIGPPLPGETRQQSPPGFNPRPTKWVAPSGFADGQLPSITDERGTDIATLAITKVWLEKVPVGDEVGCLHALRVARRAWLKFKNNPDNVDRQQPPIEDEVPYDR